MENNTLKIWLLSLQEEKLKEKNCLQDEKIKIESKLMEIENELIQIKNLLSSSDITSKEALTKVQSLESLHKQKISKKNAIYNACKQMAGEFTSRNIEDFLKQSINEKIRNVSFEKIRNVSFGYISLLLGNFAKKGMIKAVRTSEERGKTVFYVVMEKPDKEKI